MDKKLILSPKFKYLCIILIIIGVAALVSGAINSPQRFWANLLLNNYYFLTVVIGASFFLALQSVSHAGWSAGFVRVPQAMTYFIPVIFVLMIPLFFGVNHLYHWTHQDALSDPLIFHKSPYLNMGFFSFRLIIYFFLWILITQMLNRYSLKEDKIGGLKFFKKTEFLSKVYIFVLL